MDKDKVRYARIVLYLVLFSVFVLLFKAFDASTGDELLAPQMYSTAGMLLLTLIIAGIAVYFWLGQTKVDKTVKKVKRHLSNLK